MLNNVTLNKFSYQHPKIVGLLLIALVIVISYGFTMHLPELWVGAEYWYSIALQLSIAYISSFIFYLFVQYIPEQKKIKKYNKLAIKQLNRPITNYYKLLFSMFKASIKEKPKKQYEYLSDIFDAFYYDEIKNLDMKSEAPYHYKLNWISYINKQSIELYEELNTILDRYIYYLDEEFYDLVQKNLNSQFMLIFLNKHAVKIFNGTCWVNLDNYIEHIANADYGGNILKSDKMIELFRNHIDCFSELINYLNCKCSLDEKINFNNDWWNNDYMLQIGSSRSLVIDKEQNKTENKITFKMIPLVVDVENISKKKISAKKGFNITTFTFKANKRFCEFKIMVVPSKLSTHFQGSQIPQKYGSKNVKGEKKFFLPNNKIECIIHAKDLMEIVSDGDHIIKVFVRDEYGEWWDADGFRSGDIKIF